MQNTEMCGVMNRSFSHLKKIHILDTIYGLSTGQSTKAGIAIIRVSGLESFHCLKKLTNQTKPKPRYTSLRRIICPKTSEILDKAIVVWIPGPSSYTGEDLVEFHVHGSRAVLQGIFSAFEHLNQDSSSKIRPAEAGEFTRRAFENGKMDLTEIEGLGDLLSAETSAQRKQALRQMEGHMREIFEAWRDELKSCLAHTEAVIDFGDDDRENDVNDDAMWALVPRVKVLRDLIQNSLSDDKKGEILRDGVQITLLGLPNAGKSSILNTLARRPAAIVSPIAGTTRDIVEVKLDLGGVPCILRDTAGFRINDSTPSHDFDLIELEGMKRAREVYHSSHLVVFVIDISDLQRNIQITYDLFRSLYDEKIEQSLIDKTSHLISHPKCLILFNKSDLSQTSQTRDLALDSSLKSIWTHHPIPSYEVISCQTGDGLTVFERNLQSQVSDIIYGEDGSQSTEDILITRQRHRQHLLCCVEHLDLFLNCNLTMDLAAEELRLAMREVGKITGTVEVEELLDIIFRDFCIGK